MPIYNVQLSTDTEFAETKVAARSPNEAMAAAQALDPDKLHFERFSGQLPVNEITVEDPNGKTLTWRSEELATRLAAEDLYIGAKDVLMMLNHELVSYLFSKSTHRAIESLAAAVEAAEWGAQ
ncbi:hypothetical protein [Bradyrhizobium sp. WSM2254]|uniref:hypothetical protein n=1 Tax=Bradyrhizobium sp. WSM2254 TaxID=1188263 RepID=UPI0003FB16DB|nr:hypothetical protein [Bradyrhizobium sp. WSM2254]